VIREIVPLLHVFPETQNKEPEKARRNINSILAELSWCGGWAGI
jgi:hypothetical protein